MFYVGTAHGYPVVMASHVMVHHPIVCHFFVFCAGAAIIGIGIDADPAAWREDACDFYVFGIHQADEVFHDGVDTVLVEVSVIAEGEEIELE